MKNISNLLFGSAFVLAIASCSNDDFSFNKANPLEGKQTLTVNIAELGDDILTRATFYNEWENGWQEEDRIRVYNDQLGKFDVYKFEEAAERFVYTKEEGNQVVKSEQKYMLFPANATTHSGWNDEAHSLYALMKISTELNYEQLGEGEAARAYVSNMPMFGKVTKLEDGKMEANAFFLTGLLRVRIYNGVGNVKSVKVQSMKKSDEGELVENPDMPLSGTFYALLDDEGDFTAPNNSNLVAMEDEEDTYRTYIEVKAEDNHALTDYTSYIYLPIIPGTYEALQVSYTDGEGNENILWTGKEIKVEKNKRIGTLTITCQESVDDVTTPGDLQGLLEDAVKKGIAMNINVNQENGEIEVGNEREQYKYTTIDVPALSKDVTLNIYSNVNGEGNTLFIKGNGGEGKLTINYIGGDKNFAPNINIDDYKGDIALKTEGEYSSKAWYGNGGKIDANVEGNVELNGQFWSTGGINVSAESVILAGMYYNAPVTILKAKTVEVVAENKVGYIKDLSVTAESVNISKAWGAKTTVVGNATINVSLEQELSVDGNVELARNIAVNSLTLANDGESATVEVKADVAAAATEGTGETVGKTPVVTALNINGEKNVELTGIEVSNINIAKDAGQKVTAKNTKIGQIAKGSDFAVVDNKFVTIHTEGSSEITKFIDDEQLDGLKFTSLWDGKSTAKAPKGTTYGNRQYIYTASQLKGIALNDGRAATQFYLYADIDLGKDNTWSGVELEGGQKVTFNGNGHTISNLNLQKDDEEGKDNLGFFSSVKVSGEDNTFTVKDVTITGVNSKGSISNVGALIGKTTSTTVNVNNVTITGTTLGNVAKDVCNIGGMIGTIDGGNVTLTNSKVTVNNICGHYQLGGTVGSVGNEATFTVTKSPSKISDKFNVWDDPNASSYTGNSVEGKKYGTVGNVVGSILDNKSFLTLGSDGDAATDVFGRQVVSGYKSEYHFSYNFRYNSSTGKREEFVGELSSVGYSPNMAKGDEQVSYRGTKYADTSINLFQ